MADLVVEELSKSFGATRVLEAVSFGLAAGEVVALLGHSGSGKTTILRAVAGLERPDAGRIVLGETVLADAARGIDVAPEKRGLGLVFQSYALWPNRTVFDNIAYGLRLRRVAAGERDRRVAEVAARLELDRLLARYPHQLSGGQQQRVALARALVYRPPMLLLDEPLSNLDAKLREGARAWLRELILGLGIGALYVTHDQAEAMALADRILFLKDGRIEQAGTPQEIYEHPRTPAAAEFMGSNNRLEGRIGATDGDRARLDGDGFALWGMWRGPGPAAGDALGYVRVERTRLTDAAGANRIAVRRATSLYLGERWEHVLTLGAIRLRAWSAAPLSGAEAWIAIAPKDLWLFPV